MSDGLTLAQESAARKGERAEAILGDPVFVEAMDAIEAKWIGLWRKGASVEIRESCHAMLVALAEIRNELEFVLSQGTVAKAASRRITH
jgi:hypothetical protein